MDVPLIPRALLFGNPERAEPKLSPDGSWLAYVAPHNGVLNVWARARGTDRPITADRGSGITGYLFCENGNRLAYLQDDEGDENWRLYTADVATGESRALTPQGTRTRIVAQSRFRSESLAIALDGELCVVDLQTGQRTPVKADPRFTAWFVDHHLRLRGGAVPRDDGGSIVLLAGSDEPFLDLHPDDATGTQVLGFSRDGHRIFLSTTLESDASRLVSHDLRTGQQTVLAADPAHDLDSVWTNPLTLEPEVAVFVADRARYQVVDPRVANDLLFLTTQHDGEIGVSRTHDADRHWVVSCSRSDSPVEYFDYDRDNVSLQPLFCHHEGLRRYRLARTEPFTVQARDGLRLHGRATFPLDTPRHGLPAVLVVHGGPWARDRPGYNPQAQWLANRGYVCLQVDFRGSVGYGKAFTRAGDREWGAKMHDDLLDTVDFAVRQGWIDLDRVAIFGASYGGYAALVGAAFTPTVFRCAIAHSGPANLVTFMDSIPAYWRPMRALLRRRIGDDDILWTRSPLSRVADITIPVLIAHGENDPRVPRSEAQQIVKALAARGVDHEHLVFPNEGHSLVRPDNIERFSAAVERFLARHLGGRCEPPVSSS